MKDHIVRGVFLQKPDILIMEFSMRIAPLLFFDVKLGMRLVSWNR